MASSLNRISAIVSKLSQARLLTMEADLERVQLLPFIIDVINQHEQMFAHKDQQVVFEPPDEVMETAVDSQKLYQVMLNLLSNASKYSEMHKTIKVRLLSVASTLFRIEIEDEGLGLSEEDKTHLFSKFSRLSARPTADEPSTGLGLYISRFLVESMGGTIGATSEGQGLGTTFWLELPL